VAIRGLFLDLYGTLTAGDRDAIGEACAAAVRDEDLPVEPGELALLWGRCIWELAGRCRHETFRSMAQLQADSLVQAGALLGAAIDPWPYVCVLEAHWRRPRAHPDVLPFLRSVPVPVCIVSNADRDNARSALEHMGISPAFVVTSEDARSYKPNLDIFALALEATGWLPCETMHLGDSPHGDVTPARRAGLTACLVRRRCRPWDPGGEQAHHEFGGLLEALEVLNR
jgi:2-haloacid dehalogenase/putative hydrolase of the HAD superfamily